MGPVQAISLIASYLQVPLRYPLRLGGSHSYIKDFAPSIDMSGSSVTALASANKSLEFPLFLDGQDATRAAYAIFLLNKVCFSIHLSLYHKTWIFFRKISSYNKFECVLLHWFNSCSRTIVDCTINVSCW